MPGGDRSGPAGFGPITGRGMGYCAGYTVPGYMNPGTGRGIGRVPGYGGGRGYGRGMARGFGRGTGPYHRPVNYRPVQYGPVSPFDGTPAAEEEVEYLKNTARELEEDLKAIKKRIDELNREED